MVVKFLFVLAGVLSGVILAAVTGHLAYRYVLRLLTAREGARG